MKNLPEHVGQSIRERALLPSVGRILVAVSGGLDSMVLLHLLHGLSPQFGWKLFVAHFNHQLRGRASQADERLVRETAGKLGLPFQAGRGAVKTLARKRGLSVEMAARELRHEFLAQTARQLKCPVMAVAHHADDQVELFFLRALRGAGGDGLAGMQWRSVSPASRHVRISRPLLDVTKDSLKQFARERGIRFHEDASNASRDIPRNRVRHELLPLLRRRFQLALDRTILRLMDILGADAEVANEAARAWIKSKRGKRRFSEQPVGLQRRVVQLQLQNLRIEADFDLIESLRLLPGRPVSVSPGRQIQRDVSGRISRVAGVSKSFSRNRAFVRLAGAAGKVGFAGAEITWRIFRQRGPRFRRPAGAGREVFDADQIGSRIVLRHWQPGDRFQPIGMAAAVKLQDWFTNRKIPRERRRGLIVATTARGEIFWVEDQRIGERFKLTTGTRRQLDMSWRRP